MAIFRKIIGILANICYILIFIYILLVAPKVFGYTPVVVLTGSMEPTYKVGTIVYYHSINENEIKTGDVVTFKNGDQIVTHRINDIKNNLYETKGDANEIPDAKLVEYKNIVGKVAPISIPILGYAINFLNNHLYIVIGAVIILVLEFATANFDINKKQKEEEKK